MNRGTRMTQVKRVPGGEPIATIVALLIPAALLISGVAAAQSKGGGRPLELLVSVRTAAAPAPGVAFARAARDPLANLGVKASSRPVFSGSSASRPFGILSDGGTSGGSSGGVTVHELRLEEEIPPEKLREILFRLYFDPEIQDVSLSPEIRIAETGPDYFFSRTNSWGQGYGDLWGLKRVRAPEAWRYSRGEGIVVAVIDSGVDYNHPDLAENIWRNPREVPGNGIDDDKNGYIDDVVGWDFSACGFVGSLAGCAPKEPDNDPMDGHGHGTHVSGIIAAKAGNGLGIAGVAPNAKIMAVKALGDDGSGGGGQLISSIEYAVKNGAHIINLSLGAMDSPFIKLDEALQYAESQGVLVIAAAGNESQNISNVTPANNPTVFTVAATNANDEKSSFSNYAHLDAVAGGFSLVALAAPGGGRVGPDGDMTLRPWVDILSLRAAGTDMYMKAKDYVPGTFVLRDNLSPGDYYRAQGTSMAAPFVSGAAAVLLAYLRDTMPGATMETVDGRKKLFQELKARLRYSVDPPQGVPASPQGIPVSIGSGRLNLLEAITAPRRPFFELTPGKIAEIEGNGDGVPQPGELFSGSITLKNTMAAAKSVSATVSIPSGVPLEVVKGSAEFGAIGSGASAGNSLTPFTFRLTGTRPFARALPVKVSVQAVTESGTESQELVYGVIVGAQKISSTHVKNSSGGITDFVPVDRPALSDRYLVWTDTRFGNKDIMARDLDTGVERIVSFVDGAPSLGNPADQSHPAISGSRVVWQDKRSGSWVLYMLDLADPNARPQPVFSPGEVPGGQQLQPKLDGNGLVFTLEESLLGFTYDYDVYHFDLQTRRFTQLGAQVGAQFNGAISGNGVVWEEPAVLGSVFAPDVRKPNDWVNISPPLTWAIDPVVNGNVVAFTGVSIDMRNIYLAEVARGSLEVAWQKLTEDFADQGRPLFVGNDVAWQDLREGNYEIQVKDLASTDAAQQVTSDYRHDILPAVSNKWIAWLQGGELFLTAHRLPGVPSPGPTELPDSLDPSLPDIRVTPPATANPTAVPSAVPTATPEAGTLAVTARYRPARQALTVAVSLDAAQQAEIARNQSCELRLRARVYRKSEQVLDTVVLNRSVDQESELSLLIKKVPALRCRIDARGRCAAKGEKVMLATELHCAGGAVGASTPYRIPAKVTGKLGTRPWLRALTRRGVLAK